MPSDSRGDALGAVLDEASAKEPGEKTPRLSSEPGLAEARGSHIVNALTVDVEEYFQVTALAERIERGQWPDYPQRVEACTERILQMLEDHNGKATFFVLGWIAERHRPLIRRIAEQGHEIASHGFAHVRVYEQTAAEFREDVSRTKSILEDAGGAQIRGYRAASFSITPDMTWAYEVLAETGHSYSSSVYPIRHDHYGAPNASRFPYPPLRGSSITELPVATTDLMGKHLPCGGGGYFRLLPYGYMRWALKRANAEDDRPAMVYMHPWEIDPDQPRVPGLSARSRFRHYTNLDTMASKLQRLLMDFSWDRVDQVYASEIAS